MKRKIFLLYPYYWPLYKAGGPVQSLYNLATTLKDEINFYLVSRSRDIDGEKPEQPLRLNHWNSGPHRENIFSTNFISPLLLQGLLREVKPDWVMINGMFHWHTTFFGLLISRLLRLKIIISPRGMLQPWGLKRGKVKKTLFLFLLRPLIGRRGIWHATDQQEKEDINKIFGMDQQVHLASNIPRALGQLTSIPFPDQSGKIKLVFLSLINPNKNLHLIIEEVNRWDGKFTLDIYGPIIDVSYWQRCQNLSGKWTSYRGAIAPWEVSEILQHYHFFVLPTMGENFGHAIFDALASGVPVVISRNTPWQEIDIATAGFYMDLSNSNSLEESLKTISFLNQEMYDNYRRGSYAYAKRYLDTRNYKSEYQFLFGGS